MGGTLGSVTRPVNWSVPGLDGARTGWMLVSFGLAFWTSSSGGMIGRRWSPSDSPASSPRWRRTGPPPSPASPSRIHLTCLETSEPVSLKRVSLFHINLTPHNLYLYLQCIAPSRKPSLKPGTSLGLRLLRTSACCRSETEIWPAGRLDTWWPTVLPANWRIND